MTRTGFLTAAVAAFALAGCKETAPSSPQQIQGNDPVKVLESHFVSSADSSGALGGGTVTYLLARVEFTNTSKNDFTPDISHFYFQDRTSRRFQAKDQGSSVFVGVTNPTTPIKPNEKQTYTLGFRTDSATVAGMIAYEY